jgi:hypothetical protein
MFVVKPPTSAGSKSNWSWCTATADQLRGKKCPECAKNVAYGYEHIVTYVGREWHLNCLLDNLTQGVGAADNPLSLLGGAGF